MTHSDSLQEKERLKVEFLADGAHHKVYDVKHPEWSTPLVIRVAIPLDPSFKMKSEMATLAFLRERTTIPVPRCVAWGLAADTELGYDWCLMEKLPGVELRHVWREIPLEKKLELVDRLAQILSQLWKPEHKFDQIGSIDFPEQATATDHTSTTTERITVGDATTTRYTIGSAVDTCYFSGWRSYLQPDRGPFPSCRDWLNNIITVERKVITTIKTLLDHKEDMTAAHLAMNWELVENELEIDSEEEFRQDYDEAIDTVQGYYNMLPELFPDDPSVTGQPRFSLHHADFREANIFVDPHTFEVTGILDWENAMTLPDWYARADYPLLLRAAEPFDERIPHVPETFDEDDERYNSAMVSSFDRWELRILRNRYDEALEKLGWKGWRLTSDVATAKTLFLEGGYLLGTDFDQAKRHLVWARAALDGDEEEEGEEGEDKEEAGGEKEGEDKKEEQARHEDGDKREEEDKKEEEDRKEAEDKKEGEDKKEERGRHEEEDKNEDGDRSEGANEREENKKEEEDKGGRKLSLSDWHELLRRIG